MGCVGRHLLLLLLLFFLLLFLRLFLLYLEVVSVPLVLKLP
jgi:hypothetical protein